MRTLRAVAAAVALLLVGGVLATLAPAPAVAGDASYWGAPPVGACFDMTLRQTQAGHPAREDPVNCHRPHTLLVTAVALLPGRLDWSSPPSQIFKAAGRVCLPARDALIGRNKLQLYRSQYRTYFFVPTKAQQRAGARWFDCVLGVPEDSRLTRLPLTLIPLSGSMPDAIAKCVTRKLHLTTCADTHTWRSVWSFYARGKATRAHVRQAARRGCPRHVSSQHYLYSWWDIPGRRYIVGCYSRTQR